MNRPHLIGGDPSQGCNDATFLNGIHMDRSAGEYNINSPAREVASDESLAILTSDQCINEIYF